MRKIVFFAFFFPLTAIPETADEAWSQLDMEFSGELCTNATDILDYGGGDPVACLIRAHHELDSIKFPPRWHWRDRPETVFDRNGGSGVSDEVARIALATR